MLEFHGQCNISAGPYPTFAHNQLMCIELCHVCLEFNANRTNASLISVCAMCWCAWSPFRVPTVDERGWATFLANHVHIFPAFRWTCILDNSNYDPIRMNWKNSLIKIVLFSVFFFFSWIACAVEFLHSLQLSFRHVRYSGNKKWIIQLKLHQWCESNLSWACWAKWFSFARHIRHEALANGLELLRWREMIWSECVRCRQRLRWR